jgi:hypothetical protein
MAGAPTASRPRKHVPDLAEVQHAQGLGLPQGLRQMVARHDGGEVDQRAVRRGDGDPVDDRHVLGGELAAVHADPLVRCRPSSGHVDPHVVGRPKPVQPCRVAVAEHRPGDRQHGREPPPFLPDMPVPDRVDATVQRDQPPVGQATMDRSLADARRRQLPPGDNPPLDRRQPGDHPIWCEFRTSTGCFSRHIASVAG